MGTLYSVVMRWGWSVFDETLGTCIFEYFENNISYKWTWISTMLMISKKLAVTKQVIADFEVHVPPKGSNTTKYHNS